MLRRRTVVLTVATLVASTVSLVSSAVVQSAAGATAQPGTFVSVAPTRLLDTRSNLGAPGPVAAQGTVALQVTGGLVPAGVSAVVLNVTVTSPTGAGFITVYADGTARPTASNLNFGRGQTIPNLVFAPVSANGKVALFNGSPGSVQLIADVSGYFLGGAPAVPGSFASVAPHRQLDTRNDLGAPGPVAAQGTVALPVTGGVVPAGATAVVLNVTVTRPAGAGFVTVYADGTARPTASNLNFRRGQTIPNLVVAPIGTNGKVALFNGSSGPLDLIGDIAGYFLGGGAPSAAGAFVSLAPTRLLDTRTNQGAIGPVTAQGTVALQTTGTVVPTGSATAAIMNVTVTTPQAAGFITVYAHGSPRPTASNLNFARSQTIPNLAVAPIGTGGKVDLFNGSTRTVQLLSDVSGYFLSQPADTTPPANATALSATPLSTTSIQLNWTNPADADFAGVKICRAAGPTPPTLPCGGVTVTKPGASYLDNTGLLPNTQYTYSVFAFDASQNVASGASATATTPSGTDTTPPGIVTGLTATPLSSTSIKLNWTNPADADFAGVRICRAAGPTPPTSSCTPIATVNAPTATYTDTGRTPSSQYSYSVFAFDTANNTAAAATVTATTLADTTPPAKVTGLTASPLSGTSIKLDWTNPVDADFAGVTICRATGPTPPTSNCIPFATLDTPIATYVDTGRAPGTQYSYSVFSFDIANNTSAAATATATTPADVTPPGKVIGLTATPLSATAIQLNWANPADADFAGVTICRAPGSTPPTASCIPIATLNAPIATYTDTGRTAGTQYSYSVFSFDTANNTSAAATATATTLSDTTPPAKVTGLTATPLSATSIQLNWANPADADFAGVTICRAAGPTPPTASCIPIATVNAPTATFTDTGRAPSTQYSYSVFSFDTANNTSAAATATATTLADTTPPAKVTGLSATPLSATSIQLNWTNPTDADFAGVNVCRATGATPPIAGCPPIAIVNAPTATYTDTGRSPSTLYTYALFAFDTASNNSAATTVAATTLADTTPPAKVTGLTATPLSDTSIQLGWTNPGDADFAGVKICRAIGATPPIAGCTPIATVTAPTATYTDTGRAPSTQYAYSVFAFDTASNTAAATTATATTLAAVVTGISGTVTDTTGPVGAVNVQAYDNVGAPVAGAVTAGNGAYTITGLTAGTYHVCFFAESASGSSSAGYLDECFDNLPAGTSVVATTAIAVASGSVHANVNATLAKAVGFSGVVTGSDGPIQLTQANLFNSSGNYVTSIVTTPAGNGSYTITGLAISPGSYFVCWDGFGTEGNSATDYQPQCFNNKSWDGGSNPNVLSATLISLSAGVLRTNVNATLGVGGSVVGRVTDATDGFGIDGLTVYAYTSGGVVVSTANTDSDGDYVLPGLATGKVWVCFDTSFATGSSPHGYLSECYNNHAWNPLTTPTSAITDDVTVTGGATTSLDVSLARNP